MAAILHSLVGLCCKKLQELITEEAIRILGVKDEIRELQRTMNHIRYFLNDAEGRRIEESAVNNWLSELRDAMYDADNIIDLARFEGSKLLDDCHSSAKNSGSHTGLFLGCFPTIGRRHEIATQIRNFNTELGRISKMGESLLKLQSIKPREEVFIANQMKSCDLLEPNLVGKEIIYACTRLVELVVAHKDKKNYKLGIVGTGGVGKTTLAQKIYNDYRIEGKFDKQAWICVSKEYSEDAILKQVLRNFDIHHEQMETIGELKSRLATAMKKNNFFLVLDDVWQPEVWTNLLRTPLHAAANGVILVTSRHDKVAQAIGVEHVHQVELMSRDLGWELLWKSMNIEEKEVQNLRDLGMEIVNKCGGLPLAITVIARVLSAYEKTDNQWKKFLNKNAWSMCMLPAELRGALYLSYDELPRHLKQCFLYCALYPEDWVISRDDLIRFWVAEGFIEEQGEQLLEEIAEEYYYELIYRNMLQSDPSYSDHSMCRMHDLLRHLAQHLSGEDYFSGDPQSLDAKTLSKLRRVSIVTDKDSVAFPSISMEHIRIRTLSFCCEKPVIARNTIFKRIPYIRVLDLTGSSMKCIPKQIGDLIHLRLLDLDATDITCLPQSIGSLRNLQILNLDRCDGLHSLPSAITRLCNLRRLGLAGTPINQVPKGINTLQFLNDLEGFPVGGNLGNTKMQDGWNISELISLSQLRRLDMIALEKAVPLCTTSCLFDKKHLKDLVLCCSERTDYQYSEQDITVLSNTFENLIPPGNLEDLAIIGFFGQRYPTWLGLPHLCSLKYLKLINCISCLHFPPVGQLPNLLYLRIEGATAVTKIGYEFFGCVSNSSTKEVAFAKLERLVIRDMPNWEEWSFLEEGNSAAKGTGGNETAMEPKREAPAPWLHFLPRLQRIELVRCPKLRALPQQLAQCNSLKRIQLRQADSLKVVGNLPLLSDTLVITRCKSLESISNLPRVRVVRLHDCPNLKWFEMVGSLQQLWLTADMEEPSSLWLSSLKQLHQQLYANDLDVYTWRT